MNSASRKTRLLIAILVFVGIDIVIFCLWLRDRTPVASIDSAPIGAHEAKVSANQLPSRSETGQPGDSAGAKSASASAGRIARIHLQAAADNLMARSKNGLAFEARTADGLWRAREYCKEVDGVLCFRADVAPAVNIIVNPDGYWITSGNLAIKADALQADFGMTMDKASGLAQNVGLSDDSYSTRPILGSDGRALEEITLNYPDSYRKLVASQLQSSANPSADPTSSQPSLQSPAGSVTVIDPSTNAVVETSKVDAAGKNVGPIFAFPPPSSDGPPLPASMFAPATGGTVVEAKTARDLIRLISSAQHQTNSTKNQSIK